jgi:hypothetical protein
MRLPGSGARAPCTGGFVESMYISSINEFLLGYLALSAGVAGGDRQAPTQRNRKTPGRPQPTRQSDPKQLEGRRYVSISTDVHITA